MTFQLPDLPNPFARLWCAIVGHKPIRDPIQRTVLGNTCARCGKPLGGNDA